MVLATDATPMEHGFVRRKSVFHPWPHFENLVRGQVATLSTLPLDVVAEP